MLLNGMDKVAVAPGQFISAQIWSGVDRHSLLIEF